MSSKHLDLANNFNSFAYDLVTNESVAKENLESLKDDVLFRRIIFSKYYYALYHKYLAHDDDLRSKTGSSIHNAILNKVCSCNDPKLHQVFLKLLNLRVWADYKVEDDEQALSVGLKVIANDVYSIIKRSNINC